MLIILDITIIVLLNLLVITFNLVLWKNGKLIKAQGASNITAEVTKNEMTMMEEMADSIIVNNLPIEYKRVEYL